MKNIAILVYNVINDYSYSVVGGMLDYFSQKDDVKAIIAPVNVPHGNSLDFDYQYWSTVEILKSKDIDGIIVVTNSFMDKTDLESFSKELEDFSDRPVVSVSTKLNVKNSMYTFAVADDAYRKVVAHLKNKHNRKIFAFLSASMHGSSESEQRLEAFKTALKENDLEFYPDLVFPGDFTPGTAKNEILKRYKSKTDINFDALICVNDYSAGGVLLAFQEIGVNCPEDVSVIGFDNTAFSLITYPTISSINQDIPGNGKKVAEIMYETLCGKKINKKTVLQCIPIYRQSCGCVKCTIHSTSYVDSQGIYHDIDENTRYREQNVLLQQMETIENLYNLLSLMDTRIGMEQVSKILHKALNLISLSSVTACFYSNIINLEESDNFELPNSAKVLLQADSKEDIVKTYSEDSAPEFNPHETLLPEICKTKKASSYFILPLFLRENNYGYMICRTENSDLSLTSVHLKILTSILIHAYEYTKELSRKSKLLDTNRNLVFQTKTDELTKVLNRRGFIEYGKQLIDLSTSMGTCGVVFFCDLDGLKKINDTYGHKIGDLAIQTEAKVLKAAFQESDLVGRLSGDEFGIVAPGFKLQAVDKLREILKKLNKKLSEEAGLPFTLSISIGPIEYNEEDKDLLKLLTQADKNLYKEKKIKHAEKN